MRKISFAALAAAATMALAGSAQATVFSGSWQLTAYNDADPGLVVGVDVASGTFTGIDLGQGDPDADVDLFTIYTDEASVNFCCRPSQMDDIQAKSISLKFLFTEPTPNTPPAPISGVTNGQVQFFGLIQNGILNWSGPGLGGSSALTWGNPSFPLAKKGLLSISVNGGTFNTGLGGLNGGVNNGLDVSATLHWDRDAVPEPATWALMISGFGMAGATLRRRRALAA